MLHWDHQLFLADTILTVPVCLLLWLDSYLFVLGWKTGRVLIQSHQSAYTPRPRPPGQTSFAFQWSIPNMIPLTPDDIMIIWRALKTFDFDTTYGAFNGMTVNDANMKERILMSMKIQVRSMGWKDHKLLKETV